MGNEEEEEEERFLLRRRKRRKREEESSTTFLSSLSSSFDRFVWSNGRERDADDEKSVLQRDVRFALGQLCAGCAGGTIQTTKEAGNILFSEQQRLRVKWNTSLVRAESGFFERIDAREKEEKRRLMRSDDEEEEVAEEEAGQRGEGAAIRHSRARLRLDSVLFCEEEDIDDDIEEEAVVECRSNDTRVGD